jgi:indole-3-glycerol phosphate synthase
MQTILDKIVAQTAEALAQKKKKVSRRDFASFEAYDRPRLDFKAALHGGKVSGSGAIEHDRQVRIIAEVKKASPSKGVIRADFEPLKIAEAYMKAGASALSVLTEPYFFQGDLEFLRQIRAEFELPALRKDFIIETYQIEEARAYGADAVLLIAGITDGHQLQELHHAATEAGMQCLVECYTEAEFQSLDFNQVEILGVNNRDLKTFEVNLHGGLELLAKAPDHVLRVSESGIGSGADLRTIAEYGSHAALIGEHFMRQPDPGEALRKMLDEFAASA